MKVIIETRTTNCCISIKFFGLENIKPISRLQNFDYLKRMYGPIFDTISAVIEKIFHNDMKMSLLCDII